MYLPRSSKWSMNRRRRRPNLFGWTVFALMILFGYYFNRVYLPASPILAEATATTTRLPESYVTEAEQLFKEGKLTQAIEAYQAAIKASPQEPSYYVALARVQVWAGRYEEAQSNAENALLLNSNNALAHGVLAWALDFQGKNGEAMNEIEEALKIDDRSAVIQAYYVEILVDSGFENFEKAIEQSKIALALDPNIVETHRARGYLLSAIPDPVPNPDPITNMEEAIQEYDLALQINPNLALLWKEKGSFYRALALKEEAIEAFTRAITLNPSDPEPYYLISRTHATFGEYPKALQYARSAVQNSPTDPYMHGNLGVMYYRNFEWSNAVKELGIAIFGGITEEGVKVEGLPLSGEGRVIEFYFTFGMALARTNQCGDALKIVQELQAKVPNDEIAMDAANRAIEICQENLNNPPTSTPAPTQPEPASTPTAASTP
jgi:tetratricopeptide (TPR) repeat protein